MKNTNLIISWLVITVISFTLAYFQLCWLIYILFIALAFLMSVIVNNYFKVLDDIYDTYDSNEYMKTYINKLHKDIRETHTKMLEIDAKGWFQNEDEVGYVFRNIRETVDQLNDNVIELKNKGNNE